MYVDAIFKETAREYMNTKYSDRECFMRQTNPYASMIVNNLIENKNSAYCARYRDCMIHDYIDEFLKRFYNAEESIGRLPGIAKYYKSYIKYMCKPTLRNFKANQMLHLYAEHKAEIYHCHNYELKSRDKSKVKQRECYKTILTETVIEKINENIITRSELALDDLQFYTDSVLKKENVSISLDEHSLAEMNLNDYLTSVRSNKEESLLFLLGKFEDRKLNEKSVKKNNLLFNTNKISNYDRTTNDYSVKTLKENNNQLLEIEMKEKEEIKASSLGKIDKNVPVNELKLKLTSIIQDVNSKTRNRNGHNQIATVSLIKENSKTKSSKNKINFVRHTVTKSNVDSKQVLNTKANLSKSKYNTFHSKNTSNASDLINKIKKNSVNAIKNLKLKKLDFKVMCTQNRVVNRLSVKNNLPKENNTHNTVKMNCNQQMGLKSMDRGNINEITKVLKCENIKSDKLRQNTKSDEIDSKISQDQNKLLLLSTRIQNLEKNSKSRNNNNPLLFQQKSFNNVSDDKFKTEIKSVTNATANPYPKSFKVNLNVPVNFADLRNRIYGSFDSNKIVNNYINGNKSDKKNIQQNTKLNHKQLITKNKITKNFNDKKKSDSTCDKSNYLTYNSIKGKEIFSTISFQKSSNEKKENKLTTNDNNNFISKNILNKAKINLMTAFNSCAIQNKISRYAQNNNKIQIKNTKR